MNSKTNYRCLKCNSTHLVIQMNPNLTEYPKSAICFKCFNCNHSWVNEDSLLEKLKLARVLLSTANKVMESDPYPERVLDKYWKCPIHGNFSGTKICEQCKED